MAITSKPLSIANVANGKSPFTHYAWSWSQLGTDRFTQVYPNENTFWSGTQFQTLVGGVLPTRDETLAPNGFRFAGVQGGTGSFRVRNVITSNGEWTVSFKVRGSQTISGTFRMDICDIGLKVVTIPADNSWVDVDFTVNVTNWTENGYNFVDFSSIAWLQFFVSDFKVEKSATKTMWTPSPKDDPTDAYPLYQGIYTDNSAEGSTNPQKYAWQRIKGENGQNGQDGQNGQNAPYVTAVQVQYAQSLDGVTPPTSGWVSDKPTPNMGYWQWQRVRDVFSNGTYGMWVATSVYYGRDAIIVSATEPSPKVDNMLWQKPDDPTVLQWNGSAWVQWGVSIDNIVVDNATIENGVFQKIEGLEISGSTFINNFNYNPNPNGTVRKIGTTIITNGKWNTEYRQEGGKQEGVVDYTGTAILNDEALQFTRTMVAGNSEDSFMQLSSVGLTMNYGGRGGTLGYNDLYSLPKTTLNPASGWARYNDSMTSGNHPTAQRTGRLVQLAGAFKPTQDYPAGAEKIVMCTLPAGFRPITSVNQIVQASGSNMYLLSIQTNGEVRMERHRGDVSGNFDYKTLSSGAWCNIACTYAAADL